MYIYKDIKIISNKMLFDIMSIDLVRNKILEYAYPTKEQLELWRKEHCIKRNKILGLKNIHCFNISICTLCIFWKFASSGSDKAFIDNYNYKRKRDLFVLKRRFGKHFRKIINKYPQECYDNHPFF